jgi:hypothetical protein
MSTLALATISNLAGTASTSSDNVIRGSAKAWCSYNASAQTINGSFNISSVTYNGTGSFTFNFTTAMPNATYSSIGMCGGTAGTFEIRGADGTFQTTTSCNLVSINDGSVGSATNPIYVNLAVFSS